MNNEINTEKLCKDCVYKKTPLLGYLSELLTKDSPAKCHHPSSAYNPPVVNPVTGKVSKPKYHLCSVIRTVRDPGNCGRTGKFWKPKDTKKVFVLLKE